MRPLPISQRLALVAGIATAVFLSLVGAGLYFGTKASLDRGIDTGLRARAADLEHVVTQPPADIRLSSGKTTFEQLIGADGEVIAGVGGRPLIDDAERRAAASGEQLIWRGEEARLLATPAPDGAVLVVGTDIGYRERALETLATALIIGIPIASILAALAAFLIARRALSPVQQLQRRAAELALSEDEQGLTIPRTGDEVEDLARTLDEMLRRLAESRRREREFVANASHQLRTPIAIIEAELELVRTDDAADEAELRRALDSVYEESQRLEALARRLLTLSLADESAIPLSRADVDVHELLLVTAHRFTPYAARTGTTIVVRDGALSVSCDRDRLAEALDVLVDNAIVHGSGVVTLSASAQDAPEIVVEDEGQGFPAGSERDALDRFVTFGSGPNAGLGLSLADAIVAAHGGRLEVRRVGERTAVAIVLPQPTADPLPNGSATPPTRT